MYLLTLMPTAVISFSNYTDRAASIIYNFSISHSVIQTVTFLARLQDGQEQQALIHRSIPDNSSEDCVTNAHYPFGIDDQAVAIIDITLNS